MQLRSRYAISTKKGIDSKKIKQIFFSPSPLIHETGLPTFLAQEGLEVHGERLKGESLAQGLGLGEVSLAIAESGTLLQVAPDIESRLISMLCPIYVVLLSFHSLVATLEEALTWLEKKGPELSPYISLLTGPSRSADIEGILTLGVHGPGELHILLVD